MASKKTQRKVEREVKKVAKKAAKKHPFLAFVAFLLVVVILVGIVFLHKKGVIHLPFLDGIIPQDKKQDEEVDGVGGEFTQQDIQVITSSDLSIHFLELGNEYTGDCTLIKTGDTEVLIDAGSRQNSAGTIMPYIKQFCTDGVLEYVIATHADQDHIAGFIGTSTDKGVFESFICETIIDFPLTNKTTQTYNNYVQKRNAEVATGATHYTALECWNNQNGAQRSYALSDDITMNFLWQRFYEEKSSDENEYSVCMLLTQGENNYLFTGDLESEGETSLAETHDLPKCKLFKAGHHGSKTSSTSALLAEIQPEIVCVCCCCGSDEYKAKPENTFPTQAFVDRIAPYTKNVYVTTLATDDERGYTSMNGNIVVMSNDGEISVRCSNNATLFKDTAWFKENRDCPTAWQD
jgi:competence protein ComEC